ncbi:MAG: PfkB family carbohydrate kinase [Brevibacterium aurantiacum]|uniref:pyridoxal kinase n=1 Tax=Brevibacterium aurantiacum TaxID=273384 RepID=A0A2H1IW18_BREAU|nr:MULTISPECIES: PfkB family carbohydrate kinase [Brevibacterium]MDN5774464.1 PfkB family carbohydrate kinase [Brevibacterium aurantiacum]PCC47203.1 hydroxymethylpyrimidine/phosphomethylpyrimidine kinase [Brevibacterium aurantiacum]TGD39989.1 hydroxymethylpyrimidine/phosphomethylpyrimidine kinase [Brevibacterium aurantiacum]WCE38485.1 PfkB family carbohydrate kinase [Brevibacterium sp. BDJS002]SMX65901.1 pyridoxine kinase [Brevibacterium aurantiacum]
MTSKVLTIAGSDVSGGAGLEADLKMFEEYGAFGTAAVTCIVTFDPNDGFSHVIEFIDPEVVTRQLESTLAVHTFDAIKSGMLGSVENALVLAQKLKTNELPYVFDPVLVCKGAGTMVDLKDLFVDNLVPLATVITPNLEEAATLAGLEPIDSVEGMVEAAKIIHAQGAKNVVVKGGARLAGEDAIDIVFDGESITTLRSRKVNEKLVNGAGCSFASSIAAGIATGLSIQDAVVSAKEKVAHGIANCLDNATGVASLFHPAARTQPSPEVRVTVD